MFVLSTSMCPLSVSHTSTIVGAAEPCLFLQLVEWPPALPAPLLFDPIRFPSLLPVKFYGFNPPGLHLPPSPLSLDMLDDEITKD